MKRKRSGKRDPLFLDIVAGIGAGRITIGPIHDKAGHCHGYTEGRRARINPAIETADTAIHELLHVLKPQWSERYVRIRTVRIMRQLSHEEVDRLHALVVSSSRKAKKAIKV